MNVSLQKFGTTLTSRQTGKEAFTVFQHQLKELEESEKLVIDFDGVHTFSPSWGDEFLTPLVQEFGDRLVLVNAQENPSVRETLKLLEDIHGVGFLVEN